MECDVKGERRSVSTRCDSGGVMALRATHPLPQVVLTKRRYALAGQSKQAELQNLEEIKTND